MAVVALEQVQESGLIAFFLPPLSEDDLLFAEKQRLLDVRQLQFKFVLPLHSSIEKVLQIANKLIQTARILCMDEIELYFVGDDDFGPFSPRNELESLNFILAYLSSFISNVKYSAVEVLHLLHNTIFAMIKTVGDNNIDTMTAKKFGTDSEELLLKWGQVHGLKTMLSITYFEEAGRGAVALADMNIGDIGLEIPESAIISEDLVYNSDMEAKNKASLKAQIEKLQQERDEFQKIIIGNQQVRTQQIHEMKKEKEYIKERLNQVLAEKKKGISVRHGDNEPITGFNNVKTFCKD